MGGRGVEAEDSGNGCPFDALELSAREHDVRAEGREDVGDPAADPTPSAGDQRDLLIEQSIAKHGGIRHGLASGWRTSWSTSASAGASAGGATDSASVSWETGPNERRW